MLPCRRARTHSSRAPGRPGAIAFDVAGRLSRRSVCVTPPPWRPRAVLAVVAVAFAVAGRIAIAVAIHSMTPLSPPSRSTSRHHRWVSAIRAIRGEGCRGSRRRPEAPGTRQPRSMRPGRPSNQHDHPVTSPDGPPPACAQRAAPPRRLIRAAGSTSFDSIRRWSLWQVTPRRRAARLLRARGPGAKVAGEAAATWSSTSRATRSAEVPGKLQALCDDGTVGTVHLWVGRSQLVAAPAYGLRGVARGAASCAARAPPRRGGRKATVGRRRARSRAQECADSGGQSDARTDP